MKTKYQNIHMKMYKVATMSENYENHIPGTLFGEMGKNFLFQNVRLIHSHELKCTAIYRSNSIVLHITLGVWRLPKDCGICVYSAGQSSGPGLICNTYLVDND